MHSRSRRQALSAAARKMLPQTLRSTLEFVLRRRLLFSECYYLDMNPDVAASGADPWRHYVRIGWREGRSPHPMFDAAFYGQAGPPLPAGENPLRSFLARGWREGRNPNRFFDCHYYLATYPDVAASGVNPVLHFMLSGAAEGRNPSSVFNTAEYRRFNPDWAEWGVDPLSHYLWRGVREGRLGWLDCDSSRRSTGGRVLFGAANLDVEFPRACPEIP